MSDRAGGYTEYGFTAEFYDHVAPYRERADVAFFVEMAQAAGGPVLEIGCGTGRVLIPTARAGIEIVGLDLSPSMLAVCRSNLAQESAETQARVRLVEGDMRDFDLGQQFALVTLPFRPFQHLTSVEDQIACLTTIHRHLAPAAGWCWISSTHRSPSWPIRRGWMSSATSRRSPCLMDGGSCAAPESPPATISTRCRMPS